jgi:heat-inducible transcriptional repressor
VPTDLGYRFFVDRVIEELEPRPSELALDLDFSELRSEVETALQTTTDALAEVTHLLALVSAPPLEATTVRRVEVLLLQPSSSWSSSSRDRGRDEAALHFRRAVDPGWPSGRAST